MFPEIADHGEGAQGLCQIVQGKADCPGRLLFDQGSEALREISVKGVPFRFFRRPDEVGTAKGRESRVFVVGQGDPAADAGRIGGQDPVQGADRAPVAIDPAVRFPVGKLQEPGGTVFQGPAGPGISGRSLEVRMFNPVPQPFEIQVDGSAFVTPDAEKSGQPGDTRRGLAGPDDGGMNQKHRERFPSDRVSTPLLYKGR